MKIYEINKNKLYEIVENYTKLYKIIEKYIYLKIKYYNNIIWCYTNVLDVDIIQNIEIV